MVIKESKLTASAKVTEAAGELIHNAAAVLNSYNDNAMVNPLGVFSDPSSRRTELQRVREAISIAMPLSMQLHGQAKLNRKNFWLKGGFEARQKGNVAIMVEPQKPAAHEVIGRSRLLNMEGRTNEPESTEEGQLNPHD